MKKIFKTMLGHCPQNVDLVIMTPLKSTFYKLEERLNIDKTYKNVFFENCSFSIKNKNVIIILSPQGIAAQDIIELFNNTNILFFGLAGSLSSQLKIGDFVEVKEAVDEEGNVESIYTTEKFKKVRCGYSPCMLGEKAKKSCNIAKDFNCNVVDMETAYCAKVANRLNNNFISLLLISDIPEIINFWELQEQTKKKLTNSRKAAIDEIISYINKLVKEDGYERRNTY